jgi:chromosome segregation ATPase
MHKYLIVSSVTLIVAAGGCAASQAEQVKDARMEQAEADAQRSQEGVERAGAAREAAVDDAHDARGDRIAAVDPPAEGATQELNAVARERAKYQTQTQTRVGKLGVRIDAAAKKIDVLGTRAPIGLKTQLETATTEYNLLKTDVAKLEKTPTTDWEAATAKIESQISALDSRLGDLDNQIDDV